MSNEKNGRGPGTGTEIKHEKVWKEKNKREIRGRNTKIILDFTGR